MPKLKKLIITVFISIISAICLGSAFNYTYGINGYVMLGDWIAPETFCDNGCSPSLFTGLSNPCHYGHRVEQYSSRNTVFRKATCYHEEWRQVDSEPIEDEEGNVIGSRPIYGWVDVAHQYWSAKSATNIGDTEKLYCIQKDQRLDRHGNMYRDGIDVTIEALNAYKGPFRDINGVEVLDDENIINHRYNAVLAYILNQPRGRYDNYEDMLTNPAQAAVWTYMPKWEAEVGVKLTGTVYSNGDSTSTGTEIIEAGEEYADEMERVRDMKDNTDVANIEVEPFRLNGVKYTKVGPFNTTFGGTFTDIILTDEDEEIKVELFGRYEGSQFVTLTQEELETDKDYYMLIPIEECEIHWIKKINWNVEYDKYCVTMNFSSAVSDGGSRNGQEILEIDPQIKKEEKGLEIRFTEGVMPPFAGAPGLPGVPIRIDLTGFVWEDVRGGKGNDFDDVFHGSSYTEDNVQHDGEDLLLEGITVNLMDRETGAIAKNVQTGEDMTTVTDANGAYMFEDIFLSELEFYYIQFIYDGVIYTASIPLVGEDRSINSKADELVDQRKDINEQFAEITNADNISARSEGYARDSGGGVTHSLTYENNTEEYTSTLKEITEPALIIADTEKTGYDLRTEFDQGHYIINEDGNGDVEVQFTNLGLARREQPEIAVSKDLVSAEITINDYSHIYKYEERNNYVQDGTGFNVGVKFGDNYVDTYSRAIYPSDVEYSKGLNPEDPNKLRVYVTYSITLRNLSDTLLTEVNEIVDYHDENYEIVDSWFGENKEDKIQWSYTSKYGQSYNQNGYIGAYSTSMDGRQIEAGTDLEKIYIKFQVNDETVLGLLSEEATLKNVTEIFSYSTFYGEDNEREEATAGEIYAGIDRASAPGNATPGEIDTYEADTDKAPSFLLEAKGVRVIEGTIFEDNAILDGNIMSKNPDDIYTDKTRNGNGIYEEGTENTIGGAKVELLTTNGEGDIGEVATIYPNSQEENGYEPNGIDNGAKETASTIVGNDGKYSFRGIEPGNYIIRITYGNGNVIYTPANEQAGEVNVRDYKSTIVTSPKVKSAFQTQDGTKEQTGEYPREKDWYKNDADYVEDYETDRFSDARDSYTAREQIDSEIADMTNKTVTEETIQNVLTPTMDADTPEFEIEVEKYQYSTLFSETAEDIYQYKLTDIDFGIILRAMQQAQLKKEVTNVKITLPNGQILIEGNPQEEVLDYVMYLPNSNGESGDIILTVDSELIYGSQIEITYDYILKNGSERDYQSAEYYWWGEEVGDIIKFTSTTLMDYIDNELTLADKSTENGWTTIQKLDEILNTHKTDMSKDVYNKLNLKFQSMVTAEAVPPEGLLPGTEVRKQIILERLLGSTDDMSYNNNGEVIRVQRTGGSTITTELTNYAIELSKDIEQVPTEVDESKSERVVIIPPTGGSLTYIPYIIIGILGSTLIGLGIIAIRKIIKL